MFPFSETKSCCRSTNQHYILCHCLYYITLFFIKKKELIFHFREYEDAQTES